MRPTEQSGDDAKRFRAPAAGARAAAPPPAFRITLDRLVRLPPITRDFALALALVLAIYLISEYLRAPTDWPGLALRAGIATVIAATIVALVHRRHLDDRDAAQRLAGGTLRAKAGHALLGRGLHCRLGTLRCGWRMATP